MKHQLTYTIDTDEPPEQLRDAAAKALEDAGCSVLHAGCALAEPTFVVRGVNVDRRKKEPEPFELEVQAVDADAALAEVASGTMVVSHVAPAP